MKKLISVLLVCTLFISLALPASAARKTIAGSTVIDRVLPDVAFYIYEGNAAVEPEKTKPDDEIIIPLVKEGFKDADDQEIFWQYSRFNDALGPSVQDLKRNKLEPVLDFAAGKDLIRDIAFVDYTPTRRVHAQAAIRIRFVKRLVSTEEHIYSFRIGVRHNGSPVYARETYGGMISNRKIDVTPQSGTNLIFADLYNGDAVLYSTVSAHNVAVDLDNGLYAHLDLVAGGKFYGYSEMDGEGVRDDEIRNVEDPVMKAYNEVRYAYTVTTVNVKNQLMYMKFTVPEDKDYYVYNVYGEFIGMSKDNLPYSSKYYLSVSEIEIDPDLPGLPTYTVDMGKRGPELQQFIAIPDVGSPTLE